MVPLHIKQLFGDCCVIRIQTMRAFVLAYSSVKLAILALYLVFIRLFCAGEAVDVPLADINLFLSIVNLIKLILSRLVELSDLANHDLELNYAILSVHVHIP